MEIARLIDLLSDRYSYSHPCNGVRVLQTHISVVFLAGNFAYKIKKPRNLGFLDFTSLEKRKHFCLEEVRLNKRFAGDVYLGALPIAARNNGLRIGGEGEPIEWCVQMKRLPDEATFGQMLRQGQIGEREIKTLAMRVASFHRAARVVDCGGEPETIERNALENFSQSRSHIGTTVSEGVFDRTRSLTEKALEDLKAVFTNRSKEKFIRDNHGDLHLDHVYFFPEKPPPDDLVVIDCIEFNERFRFSDVAADAAFLYMDLKSCGRSDLAKTFADAYINASGDEEGRSLLPFYSAYRAAVRGKVEGFEVFESEVPSDVRKAALGRARRHWLLALRELESPDRWPFLLCVGGLPGVGKSTLAVELSQVLGGRILSSDKIRKELAGFSPLQPAASPVNQGIYANEWTEKTYAQCLQRAEAGLFEGDRIIVDATFKEEKQRRAFWSAAHGLGVPFVFILCRADPEVIFNRLRNRRGDSSDADWRIHEHVKASWAPLGSEISRRSLEIEIGQDIKAVVEKIISALSGDVFEGQMLRGSNLSDCS